MKLRHIFFAALYCILAQDPVFPQVKGIEHVIIFGIDALSVDGLSTAKTPNLDFVYRNGAHTLHSRGVMPTVSAPNWASLLMGAGPEQHGITSNEWDPNDPPFPPVVKDGEYFPSIFSILKAQNPKAAASAIYDWDKFKEMLPQKCLDYNVLTSTAEETLNLGVENFKKDKPVLSFWYFVAVDEAGHIYGHGTEEYYSSIEKIDSLLGILLTALKETGLDKSTIVFIAADHGGVDTGHGGESLPELEIPMLIYGADIKKGEISEPVNNFDMSPTIAYALGLKQPEAWIGKPLKSVFNKSNSEEQTLIKTPRIFPQGGLYNNVTSLITLAATMEGAKIYYTTDRSAPTTKSNLYTEPFRLAYSCVLKAAVISGAKESGKIRTEGFRVIDDAKMKKGLKYFYYENAMNLLPDFSSLTPKTSGETYEFSLDSIKHREDQFAIKYEGYLKIDSAGTYKFRLTSDDCSRLYIDGYLTADNNFAHTAYTQIGKMQLDKGYHKIIVEYCDNYDEETLSLRYEGPGIGMQIVPPEALFQEKP